MFWWYSTCTCTYYALHTASHTTALRTMCTPCGAISSFKLPKNSMMPSGLHDQGRPRSLTNFLSRPLRACISEELSMARPRSSEKWRCLWTDPERPRTWNGNEKFILKSQYWLCYRDSHPVFFSELFNVCCCIHSVVHCWVSNETAGYRGDQLQSV